MDANGAAAPGIDGHVAARAGAAQTIAWRIRATLREAVPDAAANSGHRVPDRSQTLGRRTM